MQACTSRSLPRIVAITPTTTVTSWQAVAEWCKLGTRMWGTQICWMPLFQRYASGKVWTPERSQALLAIHKERPWCSDNLQWWAGRGLETTAWKFTDDCTPSQGSNHRKFPLIQALPSHWDFRNQMCKGYVSPLVQFSYWHDGVRWARQYRDTNLIKHKVLFMQFIMTTK